MQIGKAFSCDTCGVNIYSGSHCNECIPSGGSEQVTHTFTAIVPADKLTPLEQAISLLVDCVPEPYHHEERKPWWKVW